MSCQNRRYNRAEAAVFSSRLRFTAQHGQKIRRRIRFLLEYSGIAVMVTKLHTWSISIPASDLQWKGPAWFILCFCVPSTSISGGTLGASLPSAPSLTSCSTQSSARSPCWVSADTTHATQWASLVAAQLRVLLKALLYLPPSLFYSFHLLWKEASPNPSSKSSSPASAASFSQMQQDLFRQTPANIPDAQCLQQGLYIVILWDFFFHPPDIQIRVNICTTLTIYA